MFAEKIDDDLVASKKLYESIQSSFGGSQRVTSKHVTVDKKDETSKTVLTMEQEEIVPQQYQTLPDTKTETGEIQKMVVVLGKYQCNCIYLMET